MNFHLMTLHLRSYKSVWMKWKSQILKEMHINVTQTTMLVLTMQSLELMYTRQIQAQVSLISLLIPIHQTCWCRQAEEWWDQPRQLLPTSNPPTISRVDIFCQNYSQQSKIPLTILTLIPIMIHPPMTTILESDIKSAIDRAHRFCRTPLLVLRFSI